MDVLEKAILKMFHVKHLEKGNKMNFYEFIERK